MLRYLSPKDITSMIGISVASLKQIDQAFDLKRSGRGKYDIEELLFLNMLMYLYKNKYFSIPHLCRFSRDEINNMYNALK